MMIGNLLMSSPGFPSSHTVHAAFTAHSVPSVVKGFYLISLHFENGKLNGIIRLQAGGQTSHGSC